MLIKSTGAALSINAPDSQSGNVFCVFFVFFFLLAHCQRERRLTSDLFASANAFALKVGSEIRGLR